MRTITGAAAEPLSRTPRAQSRVNATESSCLTAGELARRTGKIIRQSKKVKALDARRRHKLRIAIKKVRYACEFFESVYQGRKIERRRKEFTAALKGIQSGLGRLNDMQVHSRLAHRFARSKHGVPKQTEKAFAIGLLTGRERADGSDDLRDTVKAARKISDIKSFWH